MTDRPPHGTGFVYLTAVAVIFWIIVGVSCAHATTWNPPGKYDKPYTGELTVYMMPQWFVPGSCRRLFRKHGLTLPVTRTQKGCAFWTVDTCVVIAISHTYRDITPRAVLRHEIGHCNGWRH